MACVPKEAEMTRADRASCAARGKGKQKEERAMRKIGEKEEEMEG